MGSDACIVYDKFMLGSALFVTHRLKRLLDCGNWLTLETRQPVSLTFSFNLFFFSFLSGEVKWKMYDVM